MGDSVPTEPEYDQAVLEYDEELRPLAKKVLKKRWSNHQRVSRLEVQGTALDISIARLEFFQQQLVRAGVLTQQQLLDMALEWEENFGLQLAQIEDTVAASIEKTRRDQELLIKQLQKKSLATPPSGIMLPGGRIHLPEPDKKEEKK